MQYLVAGMTNRQIAAQLGISERTVQSHMGTAMRKTNKTSRTQLAVSAVRCGLVEVEHCGCTSNMRTSA